VQVALEVEMVAQIMVLQVEVEDLLKQLFLLLQEKL